MKSWEQESSLYVSALAQVPHLGTLKVRGGKQAHSNLNWSYRTKIRIQYVLIGNVCPSQ